MSWSEIKKAVNSDLSTPLNTLINNRPKGYKLQLDTYEEVSMTTATTKEYTSSTGGVACFTGTTGRLTLAVDGATISSELVFSTDANNSVRRANFGNKITFGAQSAAYTLKIAVFKYVPIT